MMMMMMMMMMMVEGLMVETRKIKDLGPETRIAGLGLKRKAHDSLNISLHLRSGAVAVRSERFRSTACGMIKA